MEANTHNQLDEDIGTLREQIRAAHQRKNLLCSITLSSESFQAYLRNAAADPSSSNSSTGNLIASQSIEALMRTNVENVYRNCVGVTAFQVQDPDPRAVDSGRVLGIRFDAFENGKSMPAYYLFLHKPMVGRPELKIYKHTIPSAIPLPALVAKYLPPPPSPSADQGVRPQRLHILVKELRRELFAHHLRKNCVARVSEK